MFPTFSCFIIPLQEKNQVDTYIPECKSLFLGFFTEEKCEGKNFKYYRTGPILVKCKAFKKNEPGFIILYEVIVDDPQIQLFDNNFIVDRFKFFFDFRRHYTYPFIKMMIPQNVRAHVKKKGETWNHSIVLNSVNINIRLANIYAKCNYDAICWYMLMTMLISDDVCILPNNLLIYLKHFDYHEMVTSKENLVSISGKNVWPLWFVESHGPKQVMKLAAACKDFVKQFYDKGSCIFARFNEATKRVKNGRGTPPNMLFYETVIKWFSTADQIMTANEIRIDKILATYEKELEFYDGQYIEELRDFCAKKTKMMTQQSDSLLAYRESTKDCAKLFSPREPENITSLLNSLIPCYKNVYGCKNFSRTILNSVRVRTALYEPRKYFLTGTVVTDELKDHLPFLLYTPFVYYQPTKNPKSFWYGNLNGSKILDTPFIQDPMIPADITRFLKAPTDDNFIAYTTRMYQIMSQYEYCYHEQIVPGYTVYGMSFDVDIEDRTMIDNYYKAEKTSRVTKKMFLREQLKRLILIVFRDMLGLEDFESTSNFFMYESLPSAPPIYKLGIRFIVRSVKYVLENISVMLTVTKALNFLTNFDSFFPGPCFDEAIYRERGHFMRLPMCCKRDPRGALTSPLVPIMVDKTRCYLPSTGLIHFRHKSLIENCTVISRVPDITECHSIKSLLPHNVIERMIKNKLSLTNKKTDFITKDYTKTIDKIVVPIIKNRLLEMGIENDRVENLKLVTERFGVTNRYILADRIDVCVKKKHIDPGSNPCKIQSFVKQESGRVYANCFAHCYGSDCKSTFLCSVDL